MFDATCTQLVIVGQRGIGKSLLKGIIVPLFDLPCYNVGFSGSMLIRTLSDTNYIIHTYGYKYIIEADTISADLDVAKIVLNNLQRNSSFLDCRSTITNELFSIIVDS